MSSKVPMSEFLRERKPQLKELVQKLNQNFDYASVLGTDVVGKRYAVTSRVTNISDGMWGECGFVARVYRKGRYFEYAFNELHASVEALARHIATAFDKISGDTYNYPPPKEEKLTQSFQDTVDVLPDSMDPGKIIEELTALNRKVREGSPLVVEANAVVGYAHVAKLFLSAEKDLEQSYIWSEAYLVATTRREAVTKTAYKSFSGMKGLEILSDMENYIGHVVDTGCKLLDTKPISPGEYDIICSPDAVGIIAHEAFGHGVEMDMFTKNRAKAEQYIGKSVASPIVQMHDGAQATRHVSSYLFDDEGNLGSDTVIIKDGVLLAGISDALSAARLGFAPTGNGKRQAFSHKAYSRMTNTFFKPGTDKLEDMIASVKHGYLIEDAESGMEDPKDWGIQVVFTFAKEIIDGNVTDNWVAPVVMTGYVPDVLKAITMVSDDFQLSGSGACGKGHKEGVKVSCGGPYIKTRARLG
ncbi:MAG: TldD/PmbA family protein [Oscillospiraceae bacterium]|nr:TldD/PmbA family protein [Oscillospiraceae bacterium]